MKKLTLTLFLALIFPFWRLGCFCFAQKTNLDSLKNILKTAQTDSARFSLNQKMIRFYQEANIETTLLYINQNLALAQKNGKTLDVASVLGRKGYALLGLGKLSESLQCFLEGVKIAEDPENETKTWQQDKKLTPRKKRLQGKTNQDFIDDLLLTDPDDVYYIRAIQEELQVRVNFDLMKTK